jgi:N-acetylglucosaminyldiphosphoundecaprenol N-acetyl-beta-D-mannosaminyltransferase
MTSTQKNMHGLTGLLSGQATDVRRILGLSFFTGPTSEAVDHMESQGGLLVAPSGPVLAQFPFDRRVRDGLLSADLTIPDSGLMVHLWNLLQHDHITKISGLAYLRELLARPKFRESGATYWVMASPSSAARNTEWLRRNGISVDGEDVYVAPFYGDSIQDPALLERIQRRNPRHVVITLGGCRQEPLGAYLKRNLPYRPAIHCIGAAIAFLTGDQVYIPEWADRLALGWLFRCASEPTAFVPRFWRARRVCSLIIRYRQELPFEN